MREKGRGKGKAPQDAVPGIPGDATPLVPPIINTQIDVDNTIDFDGDDMACALCQCEFQHNERILRIVCRHIFHVQCWLDLLVASDNGRAVCPNCRGGGRVIARFNFVSTNTEYFNVADGSPATSNRSYQSVQSILPWNPAPGPQPDGYYHASTQLPDGQLSILVDVGAWTNLTGKKIARAMAETAIKAGHTPAQWRMATPLQIAGVGSGTQNCDWEARLPKCIADSENGSECVHHFETPTVEGAGEDLPALLGLRSISSKQGVLETAPGKERLSFPGPGGYEISWSPGTEHFDLKSAPSGHLVIPLGKFENINTQQGGVPKVGTVFHARPQSDEDRLNQLWNRSSSSSSTTPRPRPTQAAHLQAQPKANSSSSGPLPTQAAVSGQSPFQ